jgi:hypothetical protein
MSLAQKLCTKQLGSSFDTHRLALSPFFKSELTKQNHSRRRYLTILTNLIAYRLFLSACVSRFFLAYGVLEI